LADDQTAALRGRRVLVVEDQFLLADLAEDILKEAGAAEVRIAADMKQALEMIERAPPIDVAAVDINLGGQSGYRLAEILLARGIPFIFVTGYGRDENLPEPLRRAPVLSKPYVPDMLLAALAGVILSFPSP
jgi:CheY-like chemotaxis protein